MPRTCGTKLKLYPWFSSLPICRLVVLLVPGRPPSSLPVRLSLSLSLPLAQMRLTGDAFESRSRSTSNNVNGYDLTIAIVVAIQESPMDQSSWLQRSSSFSCRFQASKSCLVFCLLLGRSAHTSGCKDRQIGSNWASLSMKQFYPAFESCS